MSKASRATVLLRVEDMTRLLLSGYETWDIRPYIAQHAGSPESPWRTRDGLPLCRRSVSRYQMIARAKIMQDAAEGRADALRRHVKERRMLYRDCVANGDQRTALAILDSLARLQGLTPEGELAEQLRQANEHAAALLTPPAVAARLSGDGAALPQLPHSGPPKPPGGNGTNGHNGNGHH